MNVITASLNIFNSFAIIIVIELVFGMFAQLIQYVVIVKVYLKGW